MWGDLDPLGIVFYPHYYRWFDACAHLFFEAINLNIDKLWREREILFGLVETSCRYFKPGRYHDEIRIVTHVDELKKKTLVLKHSIHESKSDVFLVEGFEQRICLDVSDRENFRALDIPDDIYAVLKDAKYG